MQQLIKLECVQFNNIYLKLKNDNIFIEIDIKTPIEKEFDSPFKNEVQINLFNLEDFIHSNKFNFTHINYEAIKSINEIMENNNINFIELYFKDISVYLKNGEFHIRNK